MTTYQKSLHRVASSLCVAGLMSWFSLAPTNAQPLTPVAGNPVASGLSATQSKNDDPAGGFTDTGSPNRRSSGGSRGDCSGLLVALVPGDEALAVSEAGCNLPSSSDSALTASATPVLWFHIPAQSEPVTGEFALLDENQLALSVREITLPQEAGIVGIQVDAELAVDQTYNWVFSLLANPRKPADNPRVAGTLQRIHPAPEVLAAIETTESLQDQAEIWLNQGIWHDALTTAVTLRQTASEQSEIELSDVDQDWQDLLSSAGLEAIADAPIQNCCRSVD